MTYKLKADLGVCQGFANCVVNAPDLFDMDDADMVVVIKEDISDEEFAYADTAVRSCPVTALVLEQQ